MTPFHEGAPPLAIDAGSRGGPERRTDIVALANGRESRNTPWAHGRRRYDIGGALASRDHLHLLTAFFEARRGRLQAFRFRDPADHKSCAPSQEISALDQPLGMGDGAQTQFQLVKMYGDGADAYARPIRKPVANSVVVAGDGAAVTAVTVDISTGLVAFDAPPDEGVVLTAGFLFDTPVRFDMDHLAIEIEAGDAGRARSVPLVEVLV